eukprot:COSAG03_NODE_21_length_21000_cov_26.440649_15_plen_59_part_00
MSVVRPTRHRLAAPGTRARGGPRAEGALHARVAGSGRVRGSVGAHETVEIIVPFLMLW